MMWLRVVLSLFALAGQSTEADAIRALPPRFVNLWSEWDAAGLAGLFLEEGDLIIPTGRTLAGRRGIEAFYASAFASGYGGTRVDFNVDTIQVKEGHFAVLDGSFSIVRKTGPPEPGRFCAILLKESDGWKILGLREMVPLS